jgi:hypothetical protein
MITQFLNPINDGLEPSNVSTDYLDRFACVPLNGRQVSCPCERGHLSDNVQIRNTISTANDLANAKGERLSSSHVSLALTANGYMVPELGDLTVDDSLYECSIIKAPLAL